jgi:hypothetical protein
MHGRSLAGRLASNGTRQRADVGGRQFSAGVEQGLGCLAEGIPPSSPARVW